MKILIKITATHFKIKDKTLKITTFKELKEEIFKDLKKIVVQTKMNETKNEENFSKFKYEFFNL